MRTYITRGRQKDIAMDAYMDAAEAEVARHGCPDCGSVLTLHWQVQIGDGAARRTGNMVACNGCEWATEVDSGR